MSSLQIIAPKLTQIVFTNFSKLFCLYLLHCRLNERTVGFMTLEILSGLNWLHTCGYVYSDLKPENILITSKGYLKLCDFGACRLITEIERGQPLEGTAMYMSPELLNGKGSLTTSVDMWSLGCVVHFMCSSRC